jgi:hypothetical protein
MCFPTCPFNRSQALSEPWSVLFARLRREYVERKGDVDEERQVSTVQCTAVVDSSMNDVELFFLS